VLIADIGDTVDRAFITFFDWLPNLVGALVVLILGYIVAKVIGGLVHRVLNRAGLDRTLHEGQAGTWVQKVTTSPSRLIGSIAFWAVFLGTISLAVSVLGIEALQDFVAAVYAYLPNVIAALLIFIVAGFVAGGVAALAKRFMGDTALGKIVATAAPILVMTIATFMILDQLKIAETIVTITYAALIGAIALGSALAFGLGGRDAAKQLLDGAVDKGRANKEQFKQDLDMGMQRAKGDVQMQKDRLEEGDAEPPDTTTEPGSTTVPRTGS
jgi:Conserved TM helix